MFDKLQPGLNKTEIKRIRKYSCLFLINLIELSDFLKSVE